MRAPQVLGPQASRLASPAFAAPGRWTVPLRPATLGARAPERRARGKANLLGTSSEVGMHISTKMPGEWTRLLVVFALAIGCGRFALAADPPVRMSYLKHTVGRGQTREYSVHLILVNPHTRPVWFLFPLGNDGVFPKDGVFPSDEDGQPFSATQYRGKGGRAIDLWFAGGYKGKASEFRAFRVPARGRLEVDGYRISDHKDIDKAIVAEAKELIVNGTTPLEKWLPYNVTANKDVTVSVADYQGLDWDETKHQPREDYRKEKVRDIRARGWRRWTVQFLPSRPHS